MMRLGRKWKSNQWGERSDEYLWQDLQYQHQYGWLKKIVVASIVFSLVYWAHISETGVGYKIDEGIDYIVSTETDWNYITQQLSNRFPPTVDLSVLKKVQSVVSKPADPLLYMMKPVSGKMISPFGWQTDPVTKQGVMHEGIDMEGALGSNIKAAAAGKVKMITESAQYGKIVILEHSQDIETLYGYMGEILVNQDDIVSQGQIIGKVGRSGLTKKASLYFEVREKGTAIDPITRIKGDFPTGEGK